MLLRRTSTRLKAFPPVANWTTAAQSARLFCKPPRNNCVDIFFSKGDKPIPIVSCNKCGTKNRVDPAQASGHVARCGSCGTPLDITKAQESAAETKPLIVTDGSFQRDVLDAGALPVMLDAWAPWCGPCRMVGPIMEQLAAESNGRYRIAKLNVDENPGTAAQFQILSIPTMLIFKNGKLVDRLVGAQPKPNIVQRLLAHLE